MRNGGTSHMRDPAVARMFSAVNRRHSYPPSNQSESAPPVDPSVGKFVAKRMHEGAGYGLGAMFSSNKSATFILLMMFVTIMVFLASLRPDDMSAANSKGGFVRNSGLLPPGMSEARQLHICVVYDRFPGMMESTDEYVMQMLQTFCAMKWSVTLVTMTQGRGLQSQNYDQLKELGVNMAMISGATAVMARGEFGAVLDAIPRVQVFFIVQTLRSKRELAPVAVVKPFQMDAKLCVLNVDFIAFEREMVTKVVKALDKGEDIPMYSEEERTHWSPRMESRSQRSTIDEDYAQFVVEKRTLELSDRIYVTSESNRRLVANLMCPDNDDCDQDVAHANTRVLKLNFPALPPEWTIRPYKQRRSIVFVGGEAEAHSVNLRYFNERVLPKLKEMDATIEIDMYTPHCTALPGVKCHDWRTNMDAVFDTALMMVYPTLIGTGVHTMNFLAMRRGVPVVTTTLGAIDFPAEQAGIVVGDKATDFANNIMGIRRNEQIWTRLSQAALRFMSERPQDGMLQPLRDLPYMTSFKRSESLQQFLKEGDIVNLKGVTPYIRSGELTYRSTANLDEFGPRSEHGDRMTELVTTKCHTAPKWTQDSSAMRLMVVYYRNPSLYSHYDRDVVQLLSILAYLKHQVTLLTEMPIATAIITNEKNLKNLGVHVVHLEKGLDEKRTREELDVLVDCFDFDAVIRVPELGQPITQALYINVSSVMDSMPKYKKIPQILFVTELYTMLLPFSWMTSDRIDKISDGQFPPPSKSFNENNVLEAMGRKYERLYWYERTDAAKSDIVLLNSDIIREKARSIWCGDWYRSHVAVAEPNCFMDEKADVIVERVLPFVVSNDEAVEPPEKRTKILFIGANVPRNVEGLAWFIEKVMPLVRAKRPGMKMAMCGQICRLIQRARAWKREGPYKGIECYEMSTQEEVDREISEALVYVNPMITGFDSNSRNLLPMKRGVPLLATPLSAQGFGDGEHIIISETPEHMADAIIRLANDKEAWWKQSRAGRDWIKANRDYHALKPWVNELAERIAAIKSLKSDG